MIELCPVCKTKLAEISPLWLNQVIFRTCEECRPKSIPGVDPMPLFLKQASEQGADWLNKAVWFESTGQEGLAHFARAAACSLANLAGTLTYQLERREKETYGG